MAIKVHGLTAFTSPLFQRGTRHPEGKMPMCSELLALCLPHRPRYRGPGSPQGGEAQSST